MYELWHVRQNDGRDCVMHLDNKIYAISELKITACVITGDHLHDVNISALIYTLVYILLTAG